MSYCVNCGVELAPSEPVCPLCHTEVQNPRQPFDRKAPQPFPARLDLFRPQSDRGFIAAILTLVLLLPAAICLACDVAYTSSAGWSMLVIGAVAMLWVFIVPALFIRRHPILFGLILDTAALLGYLFVVERFAARGLWFQHLALPIVVMVAGLFAVDYGLISKVVRGKFRQAAVVLFTAPCLPLGNHPRSLPAGSNHPAVVLFRGHPLPDFGAAPAPAGPAGAVPEPDEKTAAHVRDERQGENRL